MSKTNHRVNKDREEKLPESYSHKSRREGRRKVDQILEQFYDGDDLYDYMDDSYEEIEKIRRRA